MQGAPDATAVVRLGAVFALLFVTLGPLKIVGPFVRLTREADDATRKRIAVRAFSLAAIAVVVGTFLGLVLLENWGISIPALLLAGGIIFLLVGLSITFPTVVTPYGISALIVLLANSHDAGRTASILAILLGVMVLNLLAMLYARRMMGGVTAMVVQVLGAGRAAGRPRRGDDPARIAPARSVEWLTSRKRV